MLKLQLTKLFWLQEAMHFMQCFMENSKNKIEIVDVSVAGFKQFLQFFYLDEIKLDMENVPEVMHSSMNV